MTPRSLLLLALFVATAASAAPPAEDPYPRDDALHVNHVWSIGTHNSYHLRSPLYPNGPPDELDYAHIPLDEQLDDQGVRKFELDVYWNEDGGFNVHHINFFDQNSNCETLILCLETVRDWSLAHPGHHPIFLFIEPKGLYLPTTAPQAISDEPICDRPDHEICHYDELDAEIRSVLEPVGGPDLLLTPDEVRGSHTTLREAVLQDGWPTLRETRGQFVAVMLDEGGPDRDGYTAEHRSLEGRAMFVTSTEGRADAAVLKVDNPVGGQSRIQELVALGYIIRTRSDSLDDAQANDTTSRDAAFTSGAQVISTDYPVPGILENGFFAAIPGGTPSGCNPVSTIGLECEAADIENPVGLVPEAGSTGSWLAAWAGLALIRAARSLRGFNSGARY
jgi:hypothetical protein